MRSTPTASPGRAAQLAAAEEAVGRLVGPEFAAVLGARLLAAPAELAVPVVRALCGRQGVALLPGMLVQADAVLAGVAVHALRGRGQFRGRSALVRGSVAWCVLAPLAGVARPWVVLPRRSPLWGLAVQAALTVPVSLGVALTVVRVSRRAAREEHCRSSGDPG